MVDDAHPRILGIDLGGTKTAVILGTPSGEVPARAQFPTGTPRATRRRIADAGDPRAIALLEKAGEKLGRTTAILVDLLTPQQRAGLRPDLADRLQQAVPCIPLTGFPALRSAVANDIDPTLEFAQLAARAP